MMKKVSFFVVSLGLILSLGLLVFLYYFSADASSESVAITLDADWQLGTSTNLTVQNDSIFVNNKTETQLDISGATVGATINPETASNVIDGDVGTMWSMGLGVDCNFEGICEEQQLTIDLGAVYPITRLSYVYNAPNFNIDYSLDGVTYLNLCDDSCTLSPSVSLRYVRFDRSSTDIEEFGIYEVYLYTTAYATHTTAATQIDGTADLVSWDSFTATDDVPANTSISYEFRTSADASSWSAWGGVFGSVAADRYLQIRATLTTNDPLVTPRIDDYTINFTTSTPDPPTCDDGIQNGDETGVDCGGSCDPCPVIPTCDDGIQNGDETGIDCGGTICDACPTCDDGIQNGDETGIDCGGSVCDACPVPPTCDDGIQNGDETGVDCGGSCDPCTVPPTCDDGIQNGDETGVDCGGTICDACPVPPTCDDGIQNGDETGVDCGGSVCDACPVPPTCDDGIQNGDETGIDCGGSVCDACPVIPTCDDGTQNGDETGVDCGGSCLPCEPEPTCFDGMQNGDETGVDCGGSCPACGALPADPSCVDGVQNQGEEGIDCGGPCPACPIACPLPDPAWCDTLNCQNSISVISPVAGARYQTGDPVIIEWQNDSSAISLVEGWYIRYNIEISYNGGGSWSRIASDLIDVNFPDQSAWQAVFADTNWQSRIRNNSYTFYLPKTDAIITDQARIRVSMSRTNDNPYGCSPSAFGTSENFSIFTGKVVSNCAVDYYSFIHPEAVRSSLEANTFYYYLTQDQISAWPNINLTVSLFKLPGNIAISRDLFTVIPSGLGSFDTYGRFNIKDGTTPQDFEIIYYDVECGKTITLHVVYQDDNSAIEDNKRIKLVVPNGGEYWLLGDKHNIEWLSSYDADQIAYLRFFLSLDGGNSWPYDLGRKDYGKSQRNLLWQIPYDKSLLSETARVKVVAYDSDDNAIDSDTSDDNFEIATSFAGAVADFIEDNVSVIAKILLALSALSALLPSIIPIVQNHLATATIMEFLRGFLLFGRRRKKTWGFVYDAESGTPLPYAVVTLYDQFSNRLVETVTSDKEGRYGFVARRGSYFIRVNKKSYQIASANIIDNHALKYDDNYFGGTIHVQDGEQAILANIPMSATDGLSVAIRQINLLSTIRRVLTILNWPLIISGTIVSMIALFYFFNMYNLVVMILYIPIWILQISQVKTFKAYGLVLDYNSKGAIDLALVRAYDQKGKLIRTAASDLKGHYGIMINKGQYNVICQKPGYNSSKITDLQVTEGIKPLSETFYLNSSS